MSHHKWKLVSNRLCLHLYLLYTRISIFHGSKRHFWVFHHFTSLFDEFTASSWLLNVHSFIVGIRLLYALSHLLAKLPGICMFIMLVRRSFSQLHIFYSMFCLVIYTNFLCAHGLSNVNFHFSLSLSLSIKWTQHRSFSSSVELSITELVLCVRRIIKPIFINASDPAIKYRCRLK